MRPIEFVLPWPPATLSPNGSHGGWFAKAKARKAYLHACYLTVLADRVRVPTAARLDLLLSFVPPTTRKLRNVDNLLARMKAGLDGVAAAWNIDDAAFVRVAGEVVDGEEPSRTTAAVRVQVREHVPAWGQQAPAGGEP